MQKVTKSAIFESFWLSAKVPKMAFFVVQEAKMSFGVPLVRGVQKGGHF